MTKNQNPGAGGTASGAGRNPQRDYGQGTTNKTGAQAEPLPVFVAKATPSLTQPGLELGSFRCPFCKRDHWHGGTPGHRGAHCSDPRSPYYERGYILINDPAEGRGRA